MHENWLINLEQSTAVIVPTRSLASSLNEKIARYHLDHGRSVWEASNILVWPDYLRALWQSNRDLLSRERGWNTLISGQQALLIWTRVIEASRREEQALTLLNVQQTARAVQRSWRLMHDWQIAIDDLQQEHDADTTQFTVWVDEYRQRLSQNAMLDESMLLSELAQLEITHPFNSMVWYSYDLLTRAQQSFQSYLSERGVEWREHRPVRSKVSSRTLAFTDARAEITSTLLSARELLEQDNQHKVSIVIPDLQHRQQQVQELAREVFYPASSPLEIQQNHNVYQLSLGQPLHEWAPIEAALTTIELLKNRTTVKDLGFFAA